MLELLAMAKLKSHQRGILDQNGNSLSTMKDFELFVGLESVASGIEAFECAGINGLLQTKAYARELIAYHASITQGVNIEKRLTLRMERQSVVTRDEGPAELWCVVEEQALRRPVGGPAVMADQLDHLLEITKRPNINFQVVPQDVGLHPALTGAFSVLRFNDDWRVAYEETRRSAYYYDNPDDVEDYRMVMNHLRHLALNPRQSRAFLAQLRKEFNDR